MKTQPKCSTLSPYQRISLSMGTAALACVLGTTLAPLQPIYPAPASASSKAPAAPAPAATAPAPALPEVKPNKEGIYDFTKDTDVQNPFPNVITPAEVKELQDKTTSVRPLPSIQKIFYTPYGKNFSVENGQASGDTKTVDEIINTYSGRLGRIDFFIFIPRVDKESVYTGDGQFYPYRSSRELKNPDGSANLDLNKAPDNKIPYKLEVNGKLVGSNIADKTNIKVYIRKNQTFIHVVMEGDNTHEAIFGYEGFNHEDSSGSFGYVAFLPECGAQFHFVDDLQYRNVAHIKDTRELSQRSAGETDRFSTKPFAKLDLPDLSDFKNIAGVRFGNNQVVRNMYTPLLSYDGDPKKNSVKRPTMEELTGTNIPGYLYYSNDIDTPKDGTFTENNTEKFGNYDYGIVRDKDDNQLTTKHYYVTYRPIPTQLVVQYKNNDGSYKDASYSLLNAKNSQVTGGFKASTADVAAPQKLALEKMIKSKDTVLLSAGAGYVSEGLAYLAPGSYTVAPLAEAPDGYEWVVASTQAAGTTGSSSTQAADKEAHITAPVHKDDTSALQQAVTFVLRKKIVSVTFKNEGKDYATVAVQQSSSIDGDELKDQGMPSNPSKDGFDFTEWNTQEDGKGSAFTGKSQVNGNMEVYAQFKKKEPSAPTPAPQPGPYPLPEPVPDVPAPAPAPAPEPELIVPAIEAPAPTVPAEVPAPIVRKRPRALPQTSDPMTISAVGELGMILGAAAGSLAAALRRKRSWKRD